MSAKFGWIIDKDTIADTSAPPATNLNAVGLTGPRDIAEEVTVRLKAGEGRRFRMKDDDGEVYYEGRIILLDDADPEAEFGPMDNFGAPNAGCTSIEYFENGKWEYL